MVRIGDHAWLSSRSARDHPLSLLDSNVQDPSRGRVQGWNWRDVGGGTAELVNMIF